MDLSSEFEIMAEIEEIIHSSNLKLKLIKNERIKPQDFLNESGDEIEENNENGMKSLYLTEPLITNTKENTRNEKFGYGTLKSHLK